MEPFVLGYSNDVMSYIPSEIIIKEGGYEGNTSQTRLWASGCLETFTLRKRFSREWLTLSEKVGILSNQRATGEIENHFQRKNPIVPIILTIIL